MNSFNFKTSKNLFKSFAFRIDLRQQRIISITFYQHQSGEWILIVVEMKIYCHYLQRIAKEARNFVSFNNFFLNCLIPFIWNLSHIAWMKKISYIIYSPCNFNNNYNLIFIFWTIRHFNSRPRNEKFEDYFKLSSTSQGFSLLSDSVV